MKHPFLEKLAEAREKEEKASLSKAAGLLGPMPRVTFKLVAYEWYTASLNHSTTKEVYTLDEEDVAYLEKKLSTIEAQREHEYQEKLKALNREYGKE